MVIPVMPKPLVSTPEGRKQLQSELLITGRLYVDFEYVDFSFLPPNVKPLDPKPKSFDPIW